MAKFENAELDFKEREKTHHHYQKFFKGNQDESMIPQESSF